MATKPLTNAAIALTEKKMDMALDDIIKMSKNNSFKPKKQRVSNRGQKFVANATQDRSIKGRNFMDTRSLLRHGALARRRSNFQGNQFPASSEAARKAAVAPIRNRNFNQSRTFIVNKPRTGASTVQKVAANGRGGFIVKKQVQPANIMPKQKTQTLDSLFANMKELRMRVLSQQNNKDPEETEETVEVRLDCHGQETERANDATCRSRLPLYFSVLKNASAKIHA